jgi:hypothetical protein
MYEYIAFIWYHVVCTILTILPEILIKVYFDCYYAMCIVKII